MTDDPTKAVVLVSMWAALGFIGRRWHDIAWIAIVCGTMATCALMTS